MDAGVTYTEETRALMPIKYRALKNQVWSWLPNTSLLSDSPMTRST